MDSLNFLVPAPKKRVQELFEQCFENRKNPISEAETTKVAGLLSVDEPTARKVHSTAKF